MAALIRSGCRSSPIISLQLSLRASFHCRGRLFASVNYTSTRTSQDQRELYSIEHLPGPHSNLNGISLAKKFISDGVKRLSFQQKRTDLDPGKLILKAQVRNVETFGPIFRTKYTGLRPVGNVKISNPADVATLMRAESRSPIRPDSPVREYYRKITNKPAGLIFNNGPDWYKYRRGVNERMLQPKRVAQYEPAFNEIVTDFIARLEKIRGSHGLENEIPELEDELFKWSLESVAQVLFDERFGSLEDKVDPDVQEFINSVFNFLASSADIDALPLWLLKTFQTEVYKQFAESYDKVYAFTEKCIKRKLMKYEEQEKRSEKEQNESNMDLLKYLALTSHMTDKDLLGTYVDTFLAGVDTTATAIMWSLYELAKNQDKQLNLYQEISTVLKPGEIATVESLPKMPYLKACIKEVLRLYPVHYLHRRIEQDLVLSGYKIPAGTQVMILNYAMGRSEKYFKEPSSFKPERWLRAQRKPSESSATTDAFASLPFGFGTRMCVGRRLSELEQYLLLTRIVQNYQICYPPGEIAEPKTHGFPIMPDRPLKVQFVKRA